MLRFDKLILEDFGPYKGQQTINFPEGNGVIVIYGENMRGKTTLLNAIRYALFGTVLTRHAQTLSLTNIENWEKALEGKHGFKVCLSFTYSGANFELTRECKLRRGVSTPQSDADYEQLYYLQRNGEALGPDIAESELNRVMPESVSRFFLFDGELLQQYEELLRDESDMGRRIKESIERILGVPILTQARSNLKRLLDEAQKSESKAAQKNQQTQELGNHHERLIEERSGHEAELNRLAQELISTRVKRHSLEDEVKKTERLMTLFTERERINREIDENNRRRADKETRLRDTLSSAWKGMLNQKIRAAITRIQRKVELLRQEDTTKNFASHLVEHIKKGINSDVCPTCENVLNDDTKKTLINLCNKLTNEAAGNDNAGKIDLLKNQLNILNEAETQEGSAIIDELFRDIEDCRMECHLKNERLDEINDATKLLDESEHRRIQADYDRSVQQIAILEQGIQCQKNELTAVEQSIQKIEQKLDLLGGADQARDRKRREIVKRLHDLLNEAVGVYRDELRVRVEKDSSRFFLKLTTEPEYSGLQINQNYGLTITHKDGGLIPVRSAGAEHIVALSLMGALQRNAPLQGPIIMDSPFGRLDNSHTMKVVESLPQMAEQVVLLVYESEMEPKLARQYLLGNLRKEYQIVRQTARYSTIEARNE